MEKWSSRMNISSGVRNSSAENSPEADAIGGGAMFGEHALTIAQRLMSVGRLPFRAYPNNLAARKAIKPQAKRSQLFG